MALLLLRMVVAAVTPLTEDEAYYRLWSMTPALGYYDHPPMIAWWIWCGRQIAGDTALGVRLIPALASAATAFLVFDLAHLAGASRASAARACLWFNATLLVLAGGFLAVPDAPAAFFWTVSLWSALKARGSVGWWAGAGAAAGLAVLSKYSALFLAPGMLIWLLAGPEGRSLLRTPGPWLAALIASALFGLNLGWNAEHHWLTFDKQFGRIAARHWAPGYLGELLAGQILLLTPIIASFAAASVGKPKQRPSADLTAFFSLIGPFAAYLLIHSLHDRVQAHWPAPLYPMLAVCAAVAAERLSDKAFWRSLAVAAPLPGFVLAAAAGFTLLVPASLLGRYDVALPLRGWPAFARRIEALRLASGAAWVGASSYGLTSQLLDQKAIGAPVLQIAERPRWQNVEVGRAPDFARPGLVVDLTRRLSAAGLSACFASVMPLGEIARGDVGEPGKRYAAFVVAAPRRDILAAGCPR